MLPARVSASSPAAPLAASPVVTDAARRWLILAVIGSVQFAVSMDDTIVNTALPSIRHDLGFDDRALSWVVNAYMLLFGGFLLFGGRAADVLGRRRMFLVGVLAFTGFSALCGMSDSAELLIGGRGLQGLSAALVSPAALAVLVVTFPEGPQRTRALGIWAGLMGIGAAVGLVAGGAITEAIGWRWVFFINVPIGALVLAAAVRLLPADPARHERARLDTPGAVLATAGLLAVVFSVVEAPDHGWTAPRTLGGMLAGALALAAFAVHERRGRRPLVPPAVVASRTVKAANAVMLLAAGGLLAMFFCMTLYVQVVQGWTPLRAGLSAMVFSLVFAFVSAITTRLVQHVSTRLLVCCGCTIAALGLLLMTRLQPDSTYVEALLPALVVAGIGMGLAFVPTTAAATAGAEGHDAGIVSGLLSTCQQIGGAVGIAVLITIASDHTAALVASGTPEVEALSAGFHAAFRVDAALLLAAALLAPLLGRARAVGPAPAA
jgi:EmrB/QacA subfamily drug resistance transporter